MPDSVRPCLPLSYHQGVGESKGAISLYVSRKVEVTLPASQLTANEAEALERDKKISGAVYVVKAPREESHDEIYAKVEMKALESLGIVLDGEKIGRDISEDVFVYQSKKLLQDVLPILSREQQANKHFLEAFQKIIILLPKISLPEGLERVYQLCNPVCSKSQLKKICSRIVDLKPSDPAYATLHHLFAKHAPSGDPSILLRALLVGDNIPHSALRFTNVIGRSEVALFEKRGALYLHSPGKDDVLVGVIASGRSIPVRAFPLPEDVHKTRLIGFSTLEEHTLSVLRLPQSVDRMEYERHLSSLRRKLSGLSSVVVPKIEGRTGSHYLLSLQAMQGAVPLHLALSGKGPSVFTRFISDYMRLITHLSKDRGVYVTRTPLNTVVLYGDELRLYAHEHMLSDRVPPMLSAPHIEMSPSIGHSLSIKEATIFEEHDILWGFGHFLVHRLYGQDAPFFESFRSRKVSYESFSPVRFFEGLETRARTLHVSDVTPRPNPRTYSIRIKCYELLVYGCFTARRSLVTLENIRFFWDCLRRTSDSELKDIVPIDMFDEIRSLGYYEAVALFRLLLESFRQGKRIGGSPTPSNETAPVDDEPKAIAKWVPMDDEEECDSPLLRTKSEDMLW